MIADAKTVTVTEIHPNFKTITVTVIWGNKFSRVTRLPVILLTRKIGVSMNARLFAMPQICIDEEGFWPSR